MKKIILSICLIVSVTAMTQAQSKVTFGVTGGITSASQKYGTDDDQETSDSKIGLTLGGFANIALSDKLTLQPGLNFTQKGGKESVGDVDYSATLNYLEIPVNLLYNIEAGSGSVILGAGPTIGYGLSGKSKAEFEGDSESSDIKFGSDEDEDDYKPFELGLNFVAGYKLSNGLSFALNYNLGSNIALGDGAKANNRYFGIRIGYTFGGGE
jgi:opacity protein-like surface antigen